MPRSLKNFIIAKYQNNIIGNIGLEIFDEFALIRSLCVEEAYRKEGIGISLYENILTYAQSKEIKELYLLITTAESFFSTLVLKL
ncbi:GNAT family N-acetyltransferase [Leptospira interrogans]|uniref:GNAT family N-acetyltransferase n=1 Tax=Leptospira interrogans TaxID=173 RepID=UPI001EEEA2CE|nr:GNAT family N-acetyltransferase [Leptospira interrogans]